MTFSRRVRCLTDVQHRGLQTKELLADLQDLLPNTEDAGGANLTMNTVLQCAIDFLTQHAGRWTVTAHVISLRLPVPARNLVSPSLLSRDAVMLGYLPCSFSLPSRLLSAMASCDWCGRQPAATARNQRRLTTPTLAVCCIRFFFIPRLLNDDAMLASRSPLPLSGASFSDAYGAVGVGL